jgi:hypothetical protein
MSVSFSAHIVFRHQVSTRNSMVAFHSAGFIVHNLRLILHELSSSQKAERVGMAIKL